MTRCMFIALFMLMSIFEAGQSHAQSALPATALPDVRVGSHAGAPTLFVNGEPVPALFHFSECIPEHYAQEFTNAGFKFFSFIDDKGFLDLNWVGPGQFDFSRIDRIMTMMSQRMPNGYLMPRIHLWAPKWWVDANPAESQQYEISPPDNDCNSGSGSRHESLKSLKWRQEAGEGLRQTIRHMLKQPYASQLIGVHLSTGAGGEWHPFYADCIPDSSKPMLEAYKKYLRGKYHNDPRALQKAWDDHRVSFDTVTIPGLKERKTPDFGIFHDPGLGKTRRVLDYYEAFNDGTLEAIDSFCRIVKEESGGRLLTCINYAYQPDMPYMPLEIDHRAGTKSHRSKNIDILSSPHEYWQRDLGESGNLRTIIDSVNLHGKLFIDECDERTHFASNQLFRHSGNIWQDQQILRRAWGITFTHGAGMWYMDQASGIWYDHPDLYADFRKFQKWANWSMQLPREHRTDVALIFSNKSEFYVASQAQLDAQLTLGQVDEMSRAGAPFSRYYIEDLEQGLVPEHKVYVFLDCFYLSQRQRDAIEKLKRDEHALVWIYAPGWITDRGFSINAMKKLTGLDFKQKLDPFDDVVVDRKLFPDAQAQYRVWQDWYGALTHLSPRFIPDSEKMETWGTYENGKPGLVCKSMNGWTCVYSPTGRIPWAVMNRIYARAGVHLYCEKGDNFSANKAFLLFHSPEGGERTVTLPSPSPVYDLLNDNLIAANATQFSFTLQRKETALFMLADPKKLERPKTKATVAP